MPIHTDAFVYAGFFAPGDRMAHALASGRGAWIQMVHGSVHVVGLTLEEGDGLSATDTDRLDLRFEDYSEVLLFDVRLDVPLLWR